MRLIEVLAAAVLLLLVLLSSVTLVGQASWEQGAVERESAAHHRLRLELEREIARALSDSAAYQELVQQEPEVMLPATELLAGELWIHRRQPRSNLFEIEVQLRWTQPDGSRFRTGVTTTVWKR